MTLVVHRAQAVEARHRQIQTQGQTKHEDTGRQTKVHRHREQRYVICGFRFQCKNKR